MLKSVTIRRPFTNTANYVNIDLIMTSSEDYPSEIPTTEERESIIRQTLESFLNKDPDLEAILAELAEEESPESVETDKPSEN